MKMRQLQTESNAWKRSLEYMTDENIQMKTRLSEILIDNFDITLLTRIEYYQDQVLNEEEILHLLRHNIAEMDRMLTLDSLSRNNKDISMLRASLQQQITAAELRFNKLKSAFYDFLSENL
ncbi:MAG: hypothetical protein M3R25_08015 [Bacteroidota bacterium]|nr:hypothetical protein [Bacteroidota bacterium]